MRTARAILEHNAMCSPGSHPERRETARSAHSCAAVFEGEGEDEGDLLQSQSERSGRDGRALSMPSPALRAVDEPRRNKRTGVSFCEYDLVWNFA